MGTFLLQNLGQDVQARILCFEQEICSQRYKANVRSTSTPMTGMRSIVKAHRSRSVLEGQCSALDSCPPEVGSTDGVAHCIMFSIGFACLPCVSFGSNGATRKLRLERYAVRVDESGCTNASSKTTASITLGYGTTYCHVSRYTSTNNSD